jgi:hypothetical protein
MQDGSEREARRKATVSMPESCSETVGQVVVFEAALNALPSTRSNTNIPLTQKLIS